MTVLGSTAFATWTVPCPGVLLRRRGRARRRTACAGRSSLTGALDCPLADGAARSRSELCQRAERPYPAPPPTTSAVAAAAMINKADDLGFPERIAGVPLGGGSSGGATTDSGCAKVNGSCGGRGGCHWLAEDRRSVPMRSEGTVVVVAERGFPRGLRRQAVTLGHPLSPSLPAPINLSASGGSGCRPSRPGRGPW